MSEETYRSHEHARIKKLNHILDVMEDIEANIIDVLDGKNVISDEVAVLQAVSSLKALIAHVEQDIFIDVTDKLEPIDEAV